MAAALQQDVAAGATHMATVCEFSLNRPPFRPKVDRQSYDTLKPGVDKSLALLDWYNSLQQHFVEFLRELAAAGGEPSADAVKVLLESLDLCVVMENQFGGWSAIINRFSWFKRTFGQIRREVSREVDCDKLTKDLSRFQTFIGARATATPTRALAAGAAYIYAPLRPWRARARATAPRANLAHVPRVCRRACAPRRGHAISDWDAHDGAAAARGEEAGEGPRGAAARRAAPRHGPDRRLRRAQAAASAALPALPGRRRLGDGVQRLHGDEAGAHAEALQKAPDGRVLAPRRPRRLVSAAAGTAGTSGDGALAMPALYAEHALKGATQAQTRTRTHARRPRARKSEPVPAHAPTVQHTRAPAILWAEAAHAYPAPSPSCASRCLSPSLSPAGPLSPRS